MTICTTTGPCVCVSFAIRGYGGAGLLRVLLEINDEESVTGPLGLCGVGAGVCLVAASLLYAQH